ncbi:MAG: hypothetical protein AAGH90_01760 [Pseudomonadota bacterium]
MSVKYAKWFSYAALIFGAILLGINLWLISMGASSNMMGLIPATALPFIGVLSLINPMYVYKDDVLQARNLLGMTLFRHDKAKLSVESGKSDSELLLFLNKGNGKTKRLMSTKSLWMDRSQARSLIEAVKVRDTF